MSSSRCTDSATRRAEVAVHARDQHHELDLLAARAREVDHAAEGAARQSAGPALDEREHAGAPVALGGLVRRGAHHDHAGPSGEVHAQLVAAGDDRVAVGGAAAEHVVKQRRGGGLAGPGGRKRAVHLLGDQRAHEPEQGGRRLVAAGAVAQLAHHRVGDLQLEHVAAREHGTLVLRRRAGHRQDAGRGVEHRDARVERPRSRPRHLGQAGAGLDRLGDGRKGVQKVAICSTLLALLGAWHA